jgi:isopentenyl-diphosphate delta-isomerase
MIEVQLVDKNDNNVGAMEKLEAHEKGVLHRAISVLLFNTKGEILLQRRALHKYHTPGLWTNTCCSHPYPEEEPKTAATRRLLEEMGLKEELDFVLKFIYKADFDNGLIEHELDHVFIGFSNQTPHLNTDEAMAFNWMTIQQLKKDIRNHPENYTYWFKLIMNDHFDQIQKRLDESL